MLEAKINSKYDLIKLLQSAQIKRIIASDIGSMSELDSLVKQVEALIRTKKLVTIFVVTQ